MGLYIVHNMVMNKVNIYQAKARLSEYVDAVERGERVIICRRNRPVAELRPVGPTRTALRPVGGAKGRLTVPVGFFEPLPDEVVDAFYQGSGTPPRVASRVAKRPARDRSSGTARKRRPRR